MRKRKTSSQHNLRIAYFFCAFVLVVIGISLLLKTISVISQSLFDGQNRFTVAISTNGYPRIYSFNPADTSISILTLSQPIVLDEVGKTLGIPVDGTIRFKNNPSDYSVEPLFSTIAFTYQGVDTKLTILDRIRLYWFARGVSNRNISEHSLSTLEAGSVDPVVSKLFTDERIVQEKLTIQIINATQVSGLGNRMARLLTNMGTQVVSVSTSSTGEKTSKVSYYGDSSVTVEKIAKILKSKSEKLDKAQVSDIIITIGEDKRDSTAF